MKLVHIKEASIKKLGLSGQNLYSDRGDNTENGFNKKDFSGHAEYFLHFV